MKDKCCVPRCRGDVAVIVKGKMYCERHNAERIEMAYREAKR